MIFRLYRYDTWGNAEEGYWVNDVWRTADTIDMPEEVGSEEVLTRLANEGLISHPHYLYDAEWQDGPTWVLTWREDGKPLGELREEES